MTGGAAMIAAARANGLQTLFVLSTKSAHWFQERGFKKADTKALPMKRKVLYNYRRNAKVFIKIL